MGWGIPLLNDEGDTSFILDTRLYKGDNEFIAACYGLPEPTVPYKENQAIHKQYWDAQHELLARIGVEIHYHDVDDETSEPVLIITKSYKQASSRDSPTVLPKTLVTMSEWQDMIKEFCQRTGIPFRPPSWVLWVTWDH